MVSVIRRREEGLGRAARAAGRDGGMGWAGKRRQAEATPGFCGVASGRMVMPLADRSHGSAAGGVRQRCDVS